MLDLNLNLLGENKGLLYISSIKDKSIEEVLDTYIGAGVLTKILQQQVSEQELRTILKKCAECRPDEDPAELNTAEFVQNSPLKELHGEHSVPEVPLFAHSSDCIPLEEVTCNALLNFSILDGTVDSRFDAGSLSNSSCTSSSTTGLQEASFDLSQSTSSTAVLDSSSRNANGVSEVLDLKKSSSSVTVEESNSATSVYYDALQSLTPSDTNLQQSENHKDDNLNAIAKLIVANVVENALMTLHFNTKSNCDSDLNNNLKGDEKSTSDIKFAQSEIDIKRASREQTVQTSVKGNQDWLSSSQPDCSPDRATGTDRQWISKDTRVSRSSPVALPKELRPCGNMNPQNGTHKVGDVAPPLETNLDEDDELVNNEITTPKQARKDKLFVRNINYRTSETKLWSFFSNFGDVRYAKIVRDHKTRRSRGYGYVQFKSPEDADKVLAIRQHDLFLDDRELLCSPARSKTEVENLRQGQGFQDVSAISTSSSEYQSVESEVPSPRQEPEDIITGENYMDSLTDDMLLHIFTFLNVRERIQYERVCKRWQAVLTRSWKSVKKISFENTVRRFGGMSDVTFQKIMKRTKTVKILDISHVTKMLSDRAAEIIGMYSSNVTELDISGLPVRNKTLKEVADKCTKLRSVKLNNCHSVPEKGLWWLLHQCKDLKHIEIENNKKITGQCFHLLSPSVESLCLSQCNMITDCAIQRLGDRSHCLTELHLDHCRELTSSAVETIGKKCRMLTKLHLRGTFPKVASQGLVWLSRLHQLEELYISENLAVADSTLLALSKGCPRLRILDLTSCHREVTDAGLQDLSKCSSLEELSISYLHKVHDEGLGRVALTCNLKTLVARGCGGLTDAVLATLAEHCQLEFIDISGNTQLTKTGIRSLADAMASREEAKPLTMIVGGINIEESELPSHPLLNISQRNTCQRHLRQDLDLFADLDLEDSDYEDDFGEDDEFDGLIAGDEWVVSENVIQDLLENDDPLAMEEFEMS